MPKSFNAWPPNNPRALIRLGLGVLVVANLVALYFVIRPIGGSAQELAQQALDMHAAIRQQQGVLDRTRLLAGKIESGRGEGDKFMVGYFLPRPRRWPALDSAGMPLNQAVRHAPRHICLQGFHGLLNPCFSSVFQQNFGQGSITARQSHEAATQISLPVSRF